LVVEIAPPTKTGQTGVKLTVRGVDFARAMEYGSGIHNKTKFQSKRQASPKGRILITPKTKKALAFKWDVADRELLRQTRIKYFQADKKAYEMPGVSSRGVPSFMGESQTDDRLLFNWVMHPGIEAANKGKGYMRPALEAARPEISKLIGEDAMKNLKLKIRSIFSRPGGVNK
jgi:hypothetical protein